MMKKTRIPTLMSVVLSPGKINRVQNPMCTIRNPAATKRKIRPPGAGRESAQNGSGPVRANDRRTQPIIALTVTQRFDGGVLRELGHARVAVHRQHVECWNDVRRRNRVA